MNKKYKDSRECLPKGETLFEYVDKILKMMPTSVLTHRETWALKEYIKQLRVLSGIEQQTAELVLIRGVPGSGKTTMAKRDFPDHVLVEADMFFEFGSEYRFDPSKIKEAHEWCQKTTKQLLEEGTSVVVANTFTRLWEMDFYLHLGFPITVIEAKGSYDNIHGVPEDVVQRMLDRFEPMK